jgi:uncharacterized protein (TIGR02452 family)
MFMNREDRMKCAKETVSICEMGFYLSPSGKRVEVAATAKNAMEGTILYSPENTPQPNKNQQIAPTSIEVVNETTFSALARLDGNSGHLGCLGPKHRKKPWPGLQPYIRACLRLHNTMNATGRTVPRFISIC